MVQAFDGVLVVAFGGPQGPADIRPFLANVLRGRRVSPERIEEVAHHYEPFGGISPLTERTLRQADGLHRRFADRGLDFPVYVGMRNWHPYLEDTLARMSADGVRHAVGFIAAAHRSFSGCLQYRENVAAARQTLAGRGLADVDVVYVGDWHTSAGFIDANALHVCEALGRLPEELRAGARLVFTAHSIPTAMAERYPYEPQLLESAAAVAAACRRPDYDVVYQSRSGRPEDPWLGPDVRDHLRDCARRGVRSVVLCPVGFLCDHVEVLYDLDVEAAGVCREIGLAMVRAAAVNDDPRFIDAMAEAVMRTMDRYGSGRPLPLVARS